MPKHIKLKQSKIALVFLFFGALALILALFAQTARAQSYDITRDISPKESERLRYFHEINIAPALQMGLSGKNVRVTVMGEFASPKHRDLKGQIAGQYNGYAAPGKILRGTKGDYVRVKRQTLSGHGTHIAGTIAAKCDGKGLQGVACGSRLDIYDIGTYKEDEDITATAFYQAWETALDDVVARNESRIVSGSFNLEAPAIKAHLKTELTDADIIAMAEKYNENTAALLQDPLFKHLSGAERNYLAKLDNYYATFSILLFGDETKSVERLLAAIARFQKNDGVHLITESNVDFAGYTSIINALPSLFTEIDKDLWLSIVMVQPEKYTEEMAVGPEDLSDPPDKNTKYTTPLNGCGKMAMSYCIVAPSYLVLSTMTQRLQERDLPLLRINNRYYQFFDGHSMGAPMVAAALALMEEYNQKRRLGLNMRALVKILKENANRSFNGYDPTQHGQGMLDIGAALAYMRKL